MMMALDITGVTIMAAPTTETPQPWQKVPITSHIQKAHLSKAVQASAREAKVSGVNKK